MSTDFINFPDATPSSPGLLSAADKTKLDGLSNVTYSNATTSTAGLMSSADKTKLDGLSSYSNATTSTAGLMSASDKSKLNGLSTTSVTTTFNAIGSMIFAHGGSATPGATVSGSGLNPANASGGTYTATLSGTWRCMGYAGNGVNNEVFTTLWVRIS